MSTPSWLAVAHWACSNLQPTCFQPRLHPKSEVQEASDFFPKPKENPHQLLVPVTLCFLKTVPGSNDPSPLSLLMLMVKKKNIFLLISARHEWAQLHSHPHSMFNQKLFSSKSRHLNFLRCCKELEVGAAERWGCFTQEEANNCWRKKIIRVLDQCSFVMFHN